jgi:hypothetical protein
LVFADGVRHVAPPFGLATVHDSRRLHQPSRAIYARVARRSLSEGEPSHLANESWLSRREWNTVGSAAFLKTCCLILAFARPSCISLSIKGLARRARNPIPPCWSSLKSISIRRTIPLA